ncbi:MAG: ester cyclase [Bryobacteraceae bacterium]|jgi:predicted ester cyclase
MALTREEMDRAIDEHFGYEAADDIEGVLATLAPDVIHDIVGWPTGPTYGRENARPFYQAAFADFAESKVTCTKRLYGDNFMVDESRWEGTAPGRPFGLEGKGRPVRFRLLHIIEFAGDNKIKRENVWVDLADMIRQLPPER